MPSQELWATLADDRTQINQQQMTININKLLSLFQRTCCNSWVCCVEKENKLEAMSGVNLKFQSSIQIVSQEKCHKDQRWEAAQPQTDVNETEWIKCDSRLSMFVIISQQRSI